LLLNRELFSWDFAGTTDVHKLSKHTRSHTPTLCNSHSVLAPIPPSISLVRIAEHFAPNSPSHPRVCSPLLLFNLLPDLTKRHSTYSQAFSCHPGTKLSCPLPVPSSVRSASQPPSHSGVSGQITGCFWDQNPRPTFTLPPPPPGATDLVVKSHCQGGMEVSGEEEDAWHRNWVANTHMHTHTRVRTHTCTHTIPRTSIPYFRGLFTHLNLILSSKDRHAPTRPPPSFQNRM
jgi:hypothetical protein